MTDLPEPLVPSDVDCTDLDGFMLNVERLMASELVALSTHEVIGAALLLWCRSWKQRPAASLPDDERVLAAFARLPVQRFRKLREEVLRGFVKCADGRLYHKVLAEDALRAWDKKLEYAKDRDADRERLRRWREAKKRKRDAGIADSETPDETVDETALKRVSNGVRNGVRNGIETSSTGQDRTGQLKESPVVPLRDEEFETAWSAFPAQRKGAKDKALAAWRSAFRRHASLAADAVIAAITAYAGSDEVARGFAKGMAAWLNDDRWAVAYGPTGGSKANGADDPEIPPAMSIPIVKRANELAVRTYERHRSTDEERAAARKAMGDLFRAARIGSAEAEAAARAYLGDEA